MTNEQLAEFIKAGGNDELKPILWERVHKLLYSFASSYYTAYSSNCEKCGVTVWDLKQASYYAYIGALEAYDNTKGYKFTSYLDLQFRHAVRSMFGKDLLNTSESLNEIIKDKGDKKESLERIGCVSDTKSLNDFEYISEESTNNIVRKAVERLPNEFKDVIVCRYYRNFSVKQTCKRLRIAENEVWNRERKALNQLRKDKEMRKLALEFKRLGLL